MSVPHLFEFMDLEGLPISLRNTLREILECGNAKPFRPYYDWAADTIETTAKERNCQRVVELGAGTAPLTRHLAARGTNHMLTACDFNPDNEAYKELESQYPDKVSAIYEPVDFSVPREWPESTLLVLSATLHHLPTKEREQTLAAMTSSADSVLVLEPLRRTFSSLLFVLGSMVPAVILPLWFINRSGRLRRFFWCWLLPLAPLMFLWDGWISCLRQWPDRQYEEWARDCGVNSDVSHGLFSQVVRLWRR